MLFCCSIGDRWFPVSRNRLRFLERFHFTERAIVKIA